MLTFLCSEVNTIETQKAKHLSPLRSCFKDKNYRSMKLFVGHM